jgi:hypothetical protein
MDVKIFLYILVKRFFTFKKVYKIFLARKKPFQGNQSSGINNFAGTGKDGELKSAVLNEAETEKERELRVRLACFKIKLIKFFKILNETTCLYLYRLKFKDSIVK